MFLKIRKICFNDTQKSITGKELRYEIFLFFQRLGGSLVLSTTFPKRQFTPDDMNRTFIELQLAPTASVIALPEVGLMYIIPVERNPVL